MAAAGWRRHGGGVAEGWRGGGGVEGWRRDGGVEGWWRGGVEGWSGGEIIIINSLCIVGYIQ